jgi:hypothetical protein
MPKQKLKAGSVINLFGKSGTRMSSAGLDINEVLSLAKQWRNTFRPAIMVQNPN